MTKKILTQQEKVIAVLSKGKTIKSIAEVAKQANILIPNARRILGVGTKKGIFNREGAGLYSLIK